MIPLKAVAYHEAAHTLCAHSFGLAVATVSVVPSTHSLGRVEWSDEPGPIAPAIPAPAVMVLALVSELALRSSGAIAEELAGFDAVQGWHPGNDPDLEAEIAVEICAEIGAPAGWARSFRAAVRKPVEDFLLAHWPALEVLARALLVDRTLDGSQVRALLAGVQLKQPVLGPALHLATMLRSRYGARRLERASEPASRATA